MRIGILVAALLRHLQIGFLKPYSIFSFRSNLNRAWPTAGETGRKRSVHSSVLCTHQAVLRCKKMKLLGFYYKSRTKCLSKLQVARFSRSRVAWFPTSRTTRPSGARGLKPPTLKPPSRKSRGAWPTLRTPPRAPRAPMRLRSGYPRAARRRPGRGPRARTRRSDV